MSRFNNNRGGLGMNNFQQRRGGGPGGPMRGGLMGNPNFRSHPFQNQNQNRRGANNNFNRPGNQGPQLAPQKPQQNQSLPIIPPPSPGPALTMKGPMQQQQKPAEQQPESQQQRTPTTPNVTPQPKIQSPAPKPIMTSPPPNQANKNQNPQLKSPVGNANGQQQKQPPHPKPSPQQGPKPSPQQGPKPGPQQGQRTGPAQGQRTGPPMIPPRQEREVPDNMDIAEAESGGSQPKVCIYFNFIYFFLHVLLQMASTAIVVS